jgi:hypothetical protein
VGRELEQALDPYTLKIYNLLQEDLPMTYKWGYVSMAVAFFSFAIWACLFAGTEHPHSHAYLFTMWTAGIICIIAAIVWAMCYIVSVRAQWWRLSRGW